MMAKDLLELYFIGTIVLLIVFTVVWLIQLKTKNAAIVDGVWAASFPLLTLIYALSSGLFSFRKGVLLVMVTVWGMRLASYLITRALNHAEDVRYTALREKWGKSQNILMLRFFYFQAILVLVLSLPFGLVMLSPPGEMNWLEWTAVAVWLIAVVGESLADMQLKNFKSDPSNRGKICEDGLWNYSRHPNYFFEWLIWVSYFIFSLSSPWGWISFICPLLILYFLLNVTGIPYTEEQMIKSRGHAFVEYQKTTSVFVPLPKRPAIK